MQNVIINSELYKVEWMWKEKCPSMMWEKLPQDVILMILKLVAPQFDTVPNKMTYRPLETIHFQKPEISHEYMPAPPPLTDEFIQDFVKLRSFLQPSITPIDDPMSPLSSRAIRKPPQGLLEQLLSDCMLSREKVIAPRIEEEYPLFDSVIGETKSFKPDIVITWISTVGVF
jgi:hypothetical protein